MEIAVLWMRDVLVRIRIKIPDPYHWITDPAVFFYGFKDANLPIKIFFAYYSL
jgi:hypothetical protein